MPIALHDSIKATNPTTKIWCRRVFRCEVVEGELVGLRAPEQLDVVGTNGTVCRIGKTTPLL